MPIVLKSGSLNLLEHSGPVQACNGISLPYSLLEHSISFLVFNQDPTKPAEVPLLSSVIRDEFLERALKQTTITSPLIDQQHVSLRVGTN